LVPTRTWLNWGVNAYTAYLGFKYHGPGGLPENFFLTLGDGTLVRRMVSTYISPLGIAYTGLLVFPLGVVLVDREPARPTVRWLAGALLALLLVGIMFSVTRLALLATVGEAVLLLLLLRRRWVAALVPVLAAAAALMLYVYPSFGPNVDRNLISTRGGHGQAAISGNDSSAQEHYTYLVNDLKVDIQHPLGLGTGASTVRYGQLVGTGESAVLGVFGDLGLLGGLLYLALYVLSIRNGFRALRAMPRRSLAAMMPVVALVGGLGLVPITLTSDLWGDLSVSFLFWWAAGASATLAQLRASSSTASPAGQGRAGKSDLVA
jgi:O-antigen ligase